MIDTAALMRIKSLELRAKAVMEGFMSGLHRSPFHGFSVEFSEYREYSPGDDLRYLDWRLYARSDRYYIKRFEDETNLRCHLLVDLSRSMDYGSPVTKADYARTLACWRERFDRAWPRIETLGFDARFKRLWHFYLAYCEAGFRAGSIDVVQLGLRHGNA